MPPHGRLTIAIAGVVALCGCQPKQAVALRFELTWQGQPMKCGESAGVKIDDLRFFVSDLRGIDSSGTEWPLNLVSDGATQTDRVALVDIAPSCSGDRPPHSTVSVLAPSRSFQRLVFTVGVPFELNHANPAIAEGPLAIGAMNWGWLAGYKFLKLEAHQSGVAQRVHLGSTQCEGTFGHITGCNRDNRPRLSIPWPANAITLDASALLSAARSETSCEGEELEACRTPFLALGLNLHTARPEGDAHAFGSR